MSWLETFLPHMSGLKTYLFTSNGLFYQRKNMRTYCNISNLHRGGGNTFQIVTKFLAICRLAEEICSDFILT